MTPALKKAMNNFLEKRMTVKVLVKHLKKFPPDALVFVSGDPEGNDIRTIDEVATAELVKTNNDGTFDGVVIWPTDTIVQQPI